MKQAPAAGRAELRLASENALSISLINDRDVSGTRLGHVSVTFAEDCHHCRVPTDANMRQKFQLLPSEDYHERPKTFLMLVFYVTVRLTSFWSPVETHGA